MIFINNSKKDSKLIIQTGNVLIAIILLFNLKVFLNLYLDLINLDNPLIPNRLFYEINEDRILKGLLLVSGLIFIFIFKSLKLHRLIIAIAVVLITIVALV